MTAVLKGMVTFIPLNRELIRRRNSRGNEASGTLTAVYLASIPNDSNAAFIIAGEGERETSFPTTQYWSAIVSGQHAPEPSHDRDRKLTRCNRLVQERRVGERRAQGHRGHARDRPQLSHAERDDPPRPLAAERQGG